ncbi:hypothetical protein DL546_006004 [Coniochaeta pulveracea]|uniref:Uncharacterized protein n=1 Tax=Coniochaeta pulveracea TaxID=177199 RepID=A0A420YF85_9PEZI|nr:hypothetical protein DL546_006004 [Coniochaeta pulveracea]
MTLNITTAARLQRHTGKCTALLQRHSAFRHVRCMMLVGYNTHRYHMSGYEDELDDIQFDFLRWQFGPAPSFDWDVNHHRLQGLPDNSEFTWNLGADRSRAQAAYDADTLWTPLAELLLLLPGLTNLVYGCPSQFPPCLLRALHDKARSHRPRLHLHTFELRMLEDGSAASDGIPDPHELALITSPCLDSVWLVDRKIRVTVDSQQITHTLPGRQAQALKEMIKTEGLAPNLRKVRVMQGPTSRFSSTDPRALPRTWLPEELESRDRKKQTVALEHLELTCYGSIPSVTDADTQYWQGLTNMDTLRELHLTQSVDERGLHELQSLRFPALTALTFRCVDFPDACYMDGVKQFIRNQLRLEWLRMLAWDWSVSSFTDNPKDGSSTHQRPNRTLRTLHLEYSICLPSSPPRGAILSRFYLASPSEVTQLGAFHPCVEHLCLVVRRSKGDCNEVARYKALGASFPRLKRLSLTLDASPPGVVWPRPVVWSSPVPRPENSTDSFENHYCRVRPYTNGHIMDVMVNSALDGRLARQIFKAIASPSLETMIVRVKGGTDFIPFPRLPGERPLMNQMPGLALTPWLNGLAREWRVERLLPDADVKVREISRNAEGWVRQGDNPMGVHEMDPLVKHFRTLWPETRSGSKGWFDDWESWPLASEA